jgi:hypothetical protein
MQPFGPAMPICEDRRFNYYSTSDNGPGLCQALEARDRAAFDSPHPMCGNVPTRGWRRWCRYSLATIGRNLACRSLRGKPLFALE